MEFGKVKPEEIDKIDFSLPEDPAMTAAVLKKSAGKKKTTVYIGCAKWGRKEWVGKIYPTKTKEKEFLDHYVKNFNSIELNATFYDFPKQHVVENWISKVPKGKDFLFCPKFTNSITHIARLKNAQPQTDTFLQGISHFGKYLGPCFLQLSDNFGPKNFNELSAYLESLPADLDVFVEVRHKDWFADAGARKELFDMLHKLKKGAVITDTSGRRDCAHMYLPVPRAFIRFVGNNLHATDYTRVDEWIGRIDQWMKAGLKDLYFFMHQHEEKDSPELCDYVIEKLGEVTGIEIRRPDFVVNRQLF